MLTMIDETSTIGVAVTDTMVGYTLSSRRSPADNLEHQ
jgi:hypothetical protein